MKKISIYNNTTVYLSLRDGFTLCLYGLDFPPVAREKHIELFGGQELKGISSEEVLEALRLTILELKRRKENV